MNPSPLRRQFLHTAGGLAAGAMLPSWALAATEKGDALAEALSSLKKSPLSIDAKPHPWEAITEHNNFVEFSSEKRGVGKAAEAFVVSPWSVKISGECANPRSYTFDELVRVAPMEERIFNQRCVEGWSRIVPWNGYAFNHILKLAQPNARARYVEFRSFYDVAVMPSSRFYGLTFPYVEGLRLDEAMHPLTTLTFGVAGKPLPKQSGAPLRMVVPWKYGFKSAKSIVEIRFVYDQPLSAWSRAQPNEYGFYANVNPDVSHPRWSQTRERPLGTFFSTPTKMFNGFEAQVASLYAGMDLKANY